MSQTIDLKSVQISKNPCVTSERLKIEVEVALLVPIEDKAQMLPFTLPISGLGKGEFE